MMILFAGDNKIESFSQKFEVRDNNGKLLFYADEQEVVLGAENMKISGM